MTNPNDAAWRGDIASLESYLDDGGDIDARSSSDLLRSPLLAAIDAGQSGVAEFLLKRGASGSVRDYRGSTALHRAAGVGMRAVVEMLLQAHGSPDVRNVFGTSPLHAIAGGGGTASDEDKARICELLIDAGCAIDAQDTCGRTPLWFAASRGNCTIARILVSAGADPAIAAHGTQGSPRDVAREGGHSNLLGILDEAAD